MPGAPDSKFCGYFGGAEVQHLASPTYQWPALLFTDVVVLTGPVVEHPDLWRAGTVVNLATSYLNLALGAAGAPFKLPKKRWGTADYRDVQSILEELMGTGHELSSQAAVVALGRFARPLANEQVTRAEVKHLKVSGMHLAYGQAGFVCASATTIWTGCLRDISMTACSALRRRRSEAACRPPVSITLRRPLQRQLSP